MILFLSILAQILHSSLMIVAAPTVAGAMAWLEARWSGRSGPPILLPWRELLRLARKTPMVHENLSVVSRVAPAVALGAMVSAVSLVPSFALGMALSPLSDALVVVSLLTIARVAEALTALDSGAALPGLMQQRTGALAVMAEPAAMVAVLALALVGGSFNLDLIIAQQREGMLLPAAASAVALTALLALVFADPRDDDRGDETFSGMDLAIARMTGWLRRLVWADLIGGLFLPAGIANADNGALGWSIGLALWAAKLAAFMLGLSAVRAILGRVPRHSLPDLLGVAVLLALLATIMVLSGVA